MEWSGGASNTAIAVIGIDIGKKHIVGHDHRGAIVLRQKWVTRPGGNATRHLPPCLIGMETCVGAQHLSRKLQMLGHDARCRAPFTFSCGPIHWRTEVRRDKLNATSWATVCSR